MMMIRLRFILDTCLPFGCLLAAILSTVSPGTCWSAIIAGQIDDFQDGTTQNRTNGPVANPVNVATGGPSGAGDRFLQISSGTFGGGSRLASFNQSQWTGNCVTAGVNSISMDLKNFTGSPELIRVALRSGTGGSSTPGYSSTTAVSLPADNAWHHAVFSLNTASLTAINSPTALNTFLVSVADFRIVEAASPSLIGDSGSFQVGADNITAVPEPTALTLSACALMALAYLALRRRRAAV